VTRAGASRFPETKIGNPEGGWEGREKDYLSTGTERVRRLTRRDYSLERYRERDHKMPSQCFQYNYWLVRFHVLRYEVTEMAWRVSEEAVR
jgi:hypothetical protein